jgi:hypothetical protein
MKLLPDGVRAARGLITGLIGAALSQVRRVSAYAGRLLAYPNRVPNAGAFACLVMPSPMGF